MSENEKPEAAPGAADPTAAGTRPNVNVPNRDISLSTFVHLLGLPTATQVNVLESKLDVLTTKLSTAILKLERMATDLAAVKGDAAIDRIDFQLNDIRALLKRVAGGATGISDGDPSKAAAGSGPAGKAKVLKSEPAKPETKIVEPESLEDLAKAQEHEDFQVEQARRMRAQTKEGA